MVNLAMPQAAISSGPDQAYAALEDQIESGYPEDDDLPSYLTASIAPLPEPVQANSVQFQQSALTPNAPGGLRWTILIGLVLSTLFCLGAAFMTGDRNARHH